MARPRAASHYVCQSCAAAFSRWEGQCRSCGAWNSLVETLLPVPSVRPRAAGGDRPPVEPVPLGALATRPVERVPTGIAEVDRVLGGGIVPGAVLLLSGEPGIGKSTLLLQLATGVAGAAADEAGSRVLYASGEESGAQIHLRADRLGLLGRGRAIDVVASTEVGAVIEAATRSGPDLLVVDSIQTLTASGLEGPAGSVGQVREAAAVLGAYARSSGVPVILVGHVTKDGTLAGPRTLEHLVDVVLMLEGDRYGTLRLLRGLKNRHGPTDEVGVLEMTADGLREVEDTSRAFLREGAHDAPGLVVAAILEGTRTLLVEVEALVAPAGLGPPRRTAAGIDSSRIALLLAVLARRAGVELAARDVYASLAGGVTVGEPALDLPLALALASSHRDRAIAPGTVAWGEVSLLGEVRPVRGAERRLREAGRLGFTRAIVPAAPSAAPGRSAGGSSAAPPTGQAGPIAASYVAGLEVVAVRTLREALAAALGDRPVPFGQTRS